MSNYWVVTLFHLDSKNSDEEILNKIAVEKFFAEGIEQYSLNEETVDEILGERSYSGGDVPTEVLEEVENTMKTTSRSVRYYFNNKNNAENFTHFCSSNEMNKYFNKPCLFETSCEEVISQDWNAEWKKHFQIIKVNDDLEIIPSWIEEPISLAGKKSLKIYPGMGFGTGSHETTFLCLKIFTEDIFQQFSNKISRTLDFGSGSGILGLSVLKFCPQSHVDFYDVDLEAHKNCEVNTEINHLEKSSHRRLLPSQRNKLYKDYDLVFANILENILLEERRELYLSLKVGGFLILSGILNEQAGTILNSYLPLGFKMISQESKGDWSALLLQKTEHS